jgi:hypothetical protein
MAAEPTSIGRKALAGEYPRYAAARISLRSGLDSFEA